MEQKQDLFEDMKEDMEKVIFGEIGNFYLDDFPDDKLVQGGEVTELSQYAKVDYMEEQEEKEDVDSEQ